MEIKTTKELSEFLAKERDAFVSGEKNILTPFTKEAEEYLNENAEGPYKFIGVQGAWNIGGYHDIRSQVHEYQRQYNVSGLTVEEITLDGRTIVFHSPEDQLILTERDEAILHSEKRKNVQYFSRHSVISKKPVMYDFYDDIGGGYWPIELSLKSFNKIAVSMDWAILSIINGHNGDDFERALQIEIGYGDYHKAAYTDKGSNAWFFYIHL